MRIQRDLNLLFFKSGKGVGAEDGRGRGVGQGERILTGRESKVMEVFVHVALHRFLFY